jgi:hypothetical protein
MLATISCGNSDASDSTNKGIRSPYPGVRAGSLLGLNFPGATTRATNNTNPWDVSNGTPTGSLIICLAPDIASFMTVRLSAHCSLASIVTGASITVAKHRNYFH